MSAKAKTAYGADFSNRDITVHPLGSQSVMHLACLYFTHPKPRP